MFEVDKMKAKELKTKKPINEVHLYWEGRDDPFIMNRQEFMNNMQNMYNEGWMQINPNVEYKGFFKTYAEWFEGGEVE